MMRAIWAAATIAASGLLFACGSTTSGGGGEETTGSLRMQLDGNIASSSEMATIVIRNVFDTNQVFLIECHQKDHTLDGEPFCDELLVLPPGVYEVLVQSGDPNCVSEQQWYKVIVQPNETVELEVSLVCGGANGGLDVIVTEEEVPVITDIDFTFAGTQTPANKFVCQNDGDVVVTVTVFDSDTACADLTGTWYLKGPGDADYGTDLSDLILAGSETKVAGPNGTCLFSVTVDASAALGDYSLRLDVTDGEHTGSFSFPIHIVDCLGGPGQCVNDLSFVDADEPFQISFDLRLPQGATGTYALLNQRAVCNHSLFWDLRLANGWLVFETEGPLGNYDIASSAPLNDGLLHHVTITRNTTGQLTVNVSGQTAMIFANDASFGDLPDLQFLTDVCVGVDGTQPFQNSGGTLSNICVTPLPL